MRLPILELLTVFWALVTRSASWKTLALDEYPMDDWYYPHSPSIHLTGPNSCSATSTGDMLYTHWPNVGECVDIDYYTNSVFLNSGTGFFAGVIVAFSAGGCSASSRIGKIPGMNDTGSCVEVNNYFTKAWGGRIRSIRFN
ncbi:hypothetical protein ABW20_dc0108036 [Dactylellina cionopaga]|nr:hypothetical protein ABW20_dc0108036 [Dactylellina cionopaga]